MQTRFMSMVEAIANVLIGYGVAVAAQLIVFPLFGYAVSVATSLQMGVIFTVISLVRSYYVRRFFNSLKGTT